MYSTENKTPKDMTPQELEEAFVETLTGESIGGLQEELIKFFRAGVELELERRGTEIDVNVEERTTTFTRKDGSTQAVNVPE